jgi:NAD(P)H-dependent FMN reductase
MAGFEIPMYSADLESERGIPDVISNLYEQLKEADGLILSVNEYNGNPSAFTKNLLDWLSRKERDYLKDCPVFLMSTSPGRGAAKSSRKIVEELLQGFGARVVSRFSLPSFRHTYEEGQGITDTELREEHAKALGEFLSGLG